MSAIAVFATRSQLVDYSPITKTSQQTGLVDVPLWFRRLSSPRWLRVRSKPNYAGSTAAALSSDQFCLASSLAGFLSPGLTDIRPPAAAIEIASDRNGGLA